MNERERLLEAMKINKTDRPPCICPGGMMNMIVRELVEDKELTWPDAHIDGEKMAKLAIKSHRVGSFENYGVPFCMTVEAEAMGAEVSLGTIDTEPRVTEYCILKSEEYKNLKSINLNKGRAKAVLDAITYLKKQGGDIPIIGNLVGPISLASSLVDPMMFYKEMRKKPDEVHKLLDFVTEESLKFGIEQLKSGADIITIADPSGTGEILGEKQFATFVVPYLNKLIEGLENYKPKSVIVHICGRLKSVYKPLNDLKSGVISFDAITSVLQVKEFVKNKAIMGNVSTYTLEYGDSEKVEQISRKCVEQGVHILAPACGLGMGTPLNNIKAMKRGVL
jgi:[methyl-Co(III) methanol-specific corrinoid protein]:coenzyme M methyltransferase